jgi:hypothetical protein
MVKRSQEKTFLHDVASPLTTLQLNLESTMMILEDAGVKPEDEAIKMMKVCLIQVRKISEKICARREILLNEDSK